jgi:glycosyltransferase involved in cell wall biosynthesis
MLDLKTAIVGSGPEARELQDYARRLGADCDFVGELEKEQVYSYLEASKVFILLSQYEGLSFALLEAMARALPCIVSNVEGNSDVVVDYYNGLVINPENLGNYLEEINRLISDSLLREKLGSNALNTVRTKYSLTDRLHEMINLIESPSA